MPSYFCFTRNMIIVFQAILILMSIPSLIHINIANAQSQSRTAGGTITFTGAIVEPPCEHQQVDNLMETVCWNSLGKKEQLTITLNTMKSGEVLALGNKAKVSFQWINKQKKLGIYKIIYN
ncbi:hypothetical protein [Moellerella wisconsensis]|uniref:Type 1 fimbrial protein n=1 Tax=Moellerella wisconsensis ATCC 35017 TaxID=1354267 RepID=A0A0N0I9W8_9GAMM|nr:hypothetical protein [Moellerella wisconsensis]KPD02542.1 hypothetical protein M992_1696 [Moellerella wisconsensis ATCC 35017]VFS48283.1 Uncharacterised protein [Moellerella wisconsensis]